MMNQTNQLSKWGSQGSQYIFGNRRHRVITPSIATATQQRHSSMKKTAQHFPLRNAPLHSLLNGYESPRITMEPEFQSKKQHNLPTLKEHLGILLLLTTMTIILSPWEYLVNSNCSRDLGCNTISDLMVILLQLNTSLILFYF